MPARLREFVAAAGHFGFELDDSKKGKHCYKLRRPGERPYTVPAHNGLKTEIGDEYLKAFCRQYGIDLSEFLSKL